MANNVTTGGRENVMSKITQKYLSRMPVFRKLASFAENNTLGKGQSVNRPYRSDFTVGAYTPNTDVASQDWSLIQQLLTVDRSFVASIKIDPVEQKQVYPNLRTEFAPRLAYQLGQKMDRDFLDEVDNAALDIDGSDYGESASAPIDLGSVPAEKVWLDAFAELVNNTDEHSRGMYAVVDAHMFSEIQQRGIETTYSQSDMIFRNGMAKGAFVGFDLYVSNNLPTTAMFTMANAIPATNDVVKINGVTFTLKQTTLGSEAGNVLSETSVTQSAANLAAAINGSAGAGTKYVALSATDREKLNNAGVVATADAGVITVNAYGRMNLAKTFATAANGTWSTQTVKAMAGQYGAVDMVVQMEPDVQVNKATNNLGSTIIGHSLWGRKTFNDGAERLCKILIQG